MVGYILFYFLANVPKTSLLLAPLQGLNSTFLFSFLGAFPDLQSHFCLHGYTHYHKWDHDSFCLRIPGLGSAAIQRISNNEMKKGNEENIIEKSKVISKREKKITKCAEYSRNMNKKRKIR